MKEFPAAEMNRSPAYIFEAATNEPIAITKYKKPRFVLMSMKQYETLAKTAKTQIAVSVADMPPELGDLLDTGLEDHFDGR